MKNIAPIFAFLSVVLRKHPHPLQKLIFDLSAPTDPRMDRIQGISGWAPFDVVLQDRKALPMFESLVFNFHEDLSREDVGRHQVELRSCLPLTTRAGMLTFSVVRDRIDLLT